MCVSECVCVCVCVDDMDVFVDEVCVWGGMYIIMYVFILLLIIKYYHVYLSVVYYLKMLMFDF